MEDYSDWIKAGKISAAARDYGKKIATPGTPLLEIAEKIEAKIYELDGKTAFPVNLSLNHIAAHYTPTKNDVTLFNEGDILKIDVGASFNGAIGDTALTVGNNKELINASKDALDAAIKLCTPGTELREIGKAIRETINSYGFQPITNLSGHGLARYKVHHGISIPNYDNGDKTKLIDGQTIAIEPFATNGEGQVIESIASNIYRLVNKKPTRMPVARKVIEFVDREYKTLPFARRWVENAVPGSAIAFQPLVREGILHSYGQLPEKSKGLVSQHEHTIIVGEKPIVTTLSED